MQGNSRHHGFDNLVSAARYLDASFNLGLDWIADRRRLIKFE